MSASALPQVLIDRGVRSASGHTDVTEVVAGFALAMFVTGYIAPTRLASLRMEVKDVVTLLGKLKTHARIGVQRTFEP